MNNSLIGLMLDAIRDVDKASFKLDRMRVGVISYMGWNPQITQIYRHACKIRRIKTAPRRLIIATALIAVFSSLAVAQQPPLKSITYRLSMTKPLSHLFEVEIIVELPNQLKDKPLQFQMPKWSPGRYAVVNFAQNVQEFRANGSVTRVDNQTWSVAPQGSTKLIVSYKVFGNDLSGTFSQLNSRHANYNGGSIFMYVVGHKADPVKLAIQPPAGWRIVNGRIDRPGQTEWQFPNWDIMIDTPTEIAPDWTQDDFEVDGKKYHVVVHSFGPEGGKRPALVKDIEKIVRAQVAMWGPPEFEEYTFLLHFAADDRREEWRYGRTESVARRVVERKMSRRSSVVRLTENVDSGAEGGSPTSLGSIE